MDSCLLYRLSYLGVVVGMLRVSDERRKMSQTDATTTPDWAGVRVLNCHFVPRLCGFHTENHSRLVVNCLTLDEGGHRIEIRAPLDQSAMTPERRSRYGSQACGEASLARRRRVGPPFELTLKTCGSTFVPR